jgi:hypothetical protein
MVTSVKGAFRERPPRRILALQTAFKDDGKRALFKLLPKSEIVLDTPSADQIKHLSVRQIGIARHLSKEQEASVAVGTLAWSALSDGGLGASFRVTSRGAIGLRLGIEVDTIPIGSEIWLSATSRPEGEAIVLEAIRIKEIVDRAKLYSRPGDPVPLFWSPTVQGDTTTVHIYLPAGTDLEKVKLQLKQVSHLLGPPSKALSASPFESNYCEVDASCYPQPEADAVAHMQFTKNGQTFVCTGTLLNDADPATWRPYFLTANHCIDDPVTALTLETYWFYETQYCNGPMKKHTRLWSGADLLFTTEQTDVTLLELRDPAPFDAFLSGWTVDILTGTESVFGIHHPEGDLKKSVLERGMDTLSVLA